MSLSSKRNYARYQKFWKLIPERDDGNWTRGILRKRLEDWQFHFLVASMHSGVCENGGDMHGLCVISHDPEDLHDAISAWEAVGCSKTAAAIRLACDRARDFGWSPGSFDLDALEESDCQILRDYFIALPQEDSDEWEVKLDSYCTGHESVE